MAVVAVVEVVSVVVLVAMVAVVELVSVDVVVAVVAVVVAVEVVIADVAVGVFVTVVVVELVAVMMVEVVVALEEEKVVAVVWVVVDVMVVVVLAVVWVVVVVVGASVADVPGVQSPCAMYAPIATALLPMVGLRAQPLNLLTAQYTHPSIALHHCAHPAPFLIAGSVCGAPFVFIRTWSGCASRAVLSCLQLAGMTCVHVPWER